MTKKNKEQFPSFERPWEKNDNSIWLASTLCLHRNMKKFHFPQRLDKEKRESVSNLVTEAVIALPPLKNSQVFHGETLAPIDRDFLMEHFLVFDTARDSQHGRSYITEKTGSMLVQVNAHDHMQLHIVDAAGELEEALEKLIVVERGVEEKLPFAFSNQFGYLTSDACRCGTGLIAHSFVHVPAIVHQGLLGQIKEDDGLSFSGLQGSPDDLVGDLLVIKNKWAVGLKEETVISSLRTSVLRLVAKEQAARERLSKEKEESLVDKISRAIGILLHSFTIGTGEALQAISFVKLGIELGWVKGISVGEVNELFFDCRRAHLAKRLGIDAYATPQVHKERAQFLRQVFARVELI